MFTNKPHSNQPILAVSFLLALFSPLCIDLYVPTLPAISAEFGRSSEATISVFVLALGIGQLLFGQIYDRYGPKWLTRIALMVFIASSGLIAVCSGYVELLLLRAVQGIAVSGLALTALALIRDNFDGLSSAKYFGYINSVINLIPSLAPFLGAYLLSVSGDWRSSFLALAVIGLLLLPYFYFSIAKAQSIVSHQKFTLEFFGNRQYLSYAPVAILSLAILIAYVTFAAEIFVEKMAWTEFEFSCYFAFNGFLMFLSGIAFGRLTRRHSIISLYHAGVIILAASSLFMMAHVLGSDFSIMVGLSLYGIAFCFLIASGCALSLASLRRNIGKAISIITCLQMVLGSAIGFLILALPFAPSKQLAIAALLFLAYNIANMLWQKSAFLR